MTTALAMPVSIETLADLQAHLGGIPPHRIRVRPALGTATEQDVLDLHAREKRLYELVDGMLVEKTMGFMESSLAGDILVLLKLFVKPRKLGLISGEAGMMRLASGLVRIPDVAFVAWEAIPEGRMPDKPIPDLAPTLAVEVLSEGNTEAEMERKRGEYFAAGTRLVWIVNPVTRTVQVFTAADQYTIVDEQGTLDGGQVLPGFTLPLRELFSTLDEVAP